MSLRPLRDNVIIKREAPDTQSAGGLYLPEDRYDRYKGEGDVVAVGPEVTQLKVGQRVIFGQYAGREEQDMIIMKEADVLCVREDV